MRLKRLVFLPGLSVLSSGIVENIPKELRSKAELSRLTPRRIARVVIATVHKPIEHTSRADNDIDACVVLNNLPNVALLEGSKMIARAQRRISPVQTVNDLREILNRRLPDVGKRFLITNILFWRPGSPGWSPDYRLGLVWNQYHWISCLFQSDALFASDCGVLGLESSKKKRQSSF